ncbi:TolC family protein [Aestuariivivens sediminicola]|uniref:TolC family protein n=1 Tax=Aestuariivivens sediminicola TaxID=2913560 RepID=UPI001F560EB0|nr:TolC family protein [Aestuariivivens sediminicola]
MKNILLSVLILIGAAVQAQVEPTIISLSEYLGYVKRFHPIVKQANLVISESEAKLLKARGAFDPKIEVDYDSKTFKNTDYYDKLNTTFKIPTWYGIELKGSFEENDGVFLNPEASLPEDGLYSVGVSVSVARGLLNNERMAVLRQSKLFVKQAKADRQLLVNEILYEATLSYFNWLRSYNEMRLFEDFLDNTSRRFEGIKKSFEEGELSAIDTLEAKIALNNRALSLEKSRITFTKSSLELSNYLWLNENTPIEIADGVIPDLSTLQSIDEALQISGFLIDSINLNDHPKIQSLDYKLQSLNIEKRLKVNNLLPTVDLQYNFLSQTPDIVSTFNTAAYKGGINIRIPLFLRKERGDLKLAKLKIQDTRFEMESTKVKIKNKFDALDQELTSLSTQNRYIKSIVNDYDTLLKAEERKFFLGESSLFLVNTRESKLIDSKLKSIALETNFLNTKAMLFNVLSLPQDDPVN